MAKTKRPDRPKSRLPDGRVNPEYTKWRKENVPTLKEPKMLTDSMVAAVMDQLGDPQPLELRPVTEEDREKLSAWITAEPELLTLRVIGPARNSNFVCCDHDGNRVFVRVDRRAQKKLRGKSIQVRPADDGNFEHVP